MKRMKKSSVSAALRRAIIEGGVPYLTLEQETGVDRSSIQRFVDGKNSLRLDKADELAAYFGLKLTKEG